MLMKLIKLEWGLTSFMCTHFLYVICRAEPSCMWGILGISLARLLFLHHFNLGLRSLSVEHLTSPKEHCLCSSEKRALDPLCENFEWDKQERFGPKPLVISLRDANGKFKENKHTPGLLSMEKQITANTIVVVTYCEFGEQWSKNEVNLIFHCLQHVVPCSHF